MRPAGVRLPHRPLMESKAYPPSQRAADIRRLREEITERQVQLTELVKKCLHVTDDWQSAADDGDEWGVLKCSVCGTMM